MYGKTLTIVINTAYTKSFLMKGKLNAKIMNKHEHHTGLAHSSTDSEIEKTAKMNKNTDLALSGLGNYIIVVMKGAK